MPVLQGWAKNKKVEREMVCGGVVGCWVSGPVVVAHGVGPNGARAGDLVFAKETQLRRDLKCCGLP